MRCFATLLAMIGALYCRNIFDPIDLEKIFDTKHVENLHENPEDAPDIGPVAFAYKEKASNPPTTDTEKLLPVSAKNAGAAAGSEDRTQPPKPQVVASSISASVSVSSADTPATPKSKEEVKSASSSVSDVKAPLGRTTSQAPPFGDNAGKDKPDSIRRWTTVIGGDRPQKVLIGVRTITIIESVIREPTASVVSASVVSSGPAVSEKNVKAEDISKTASVPKDTKPGAAPSAKGAAGSKTPESGSAPSKPDVKKDVQRESKSVNASQDDRDASKSAGKTSNKNVVAKNVESAPKAATPSGASGKDANKSPEKVIAPSSLPTKDMSTDGKKDTKSVSKSVSMSASKDAPDAMSVSKVETSSVGTKQPAPPGMAVSSSVNVKSKSTDTGSTKVSSVNVDKKGTKGGESKSGEASKSVKSVEKSVAPRDVNPPKPASGDKKASTEPKKGAPASKSSKKDTKKDAKKDGGYDILTSIGGFGNADTEENSTNDAGADNKENGQKEPKPPAQKTPGKDDDNFVDLFSFVNGISKKEGKRMRMFINGDFHAKQSEKDSNSPDSKFKFEGWVQKNGS